MFLSSKKIPTVLCRGCSFLGKTLNAEKAGALAVIIMDNDHNNDQRMIDMIGDDTERDVNIPAFFLLGKDGYGHTPFK